MRNRILTLAIIAGMAAGSSSMALAQDPVSAAIGTAGAIAGSAIYTAGAIAGTAVGVATGTTAAVVGAYPYGYYGGYNYGGYGSGYGYSDSSGSRVAELQSRLASAGYYHGAIDGIMGPATRRAIRAYERDNGYAG